MDGVTGELTPAQIRLLATELAWIRPLGPYPGWCFDRDWDNSGLAFQLRRTIWTHISQTCPGQPFVMDWHEGLCVQTYWGTDEGRQLYVGGCIEPNELAFLHRALDEGMVCIDIGANNGLFTLIASLRVGSSGLVWAFEPSQREFDRLRANMALNGLDNIVPYRLALANFEGSADLKVAESEHAGHNTLGEFAYRTPLLHTERVPVRSLDRLAGDARLQRVDVIKIDAEGAEYAILEGATQVLETFEPLLMFEVFPRSLEAQGSSVELLADLLLAQEYTFYRFNPETGLPVCLEDNLVEGNIIAVPADVSLPGLLTQAGGVALAAE